jgi:uncharacterized membrane protein
VLIEGIALCLCAPVMSYVLGKSLFDTGVLTIALATCAMLWNMLYNAMFERVENKFGLNRTEPVRIGYAVGFEGGLVLVLAAWWLSISYRDAFLLEMRLIAFFLPYTSVYNLLYDQVRGGWCGEGQTSKRGVFIENAANSLRNLLSFDAKCHNPFSNINATWRRFQSLGLQAELSLKHLTS